MLLDEFQDGVRFVDLSALRDGAQVVPAIVQVTGATDQLLTPSDAVLEWLRPRELLLVLDNCEQVIDGVAAMCSEILHGAPGVTLLATSRVPIRIRGERQMALEPLPVSENSPDHSAARLFTERAREVDESFALDAGNADEIAAICRIVDGLPLAIELAAAWVRILSPEALHRRLQDGRSMLRDGARDLPDRQRTLTTTIAWSYDLLEPEDQRAFRRLAVFRGGIAVDAAAAVIWEAPVEDPLWALSRLDALVQANLLQVAPDPSGEPRFLMLQTIQEFAVEVLRNAGEWDDAASAHAEFFSELAIGADTFSQSSNIAAWFDRLDRELDNLRIAVETFGNAGLPMILALFEFLDTRGHQAEARNWLEAALGSTSSPTIDQKQVSRAYAHLGQCYPDDPEQAEACFRRALDAAEQTGDPSHIAYSRAMIGIAARSRGDYPEALEALENCVAVAREQANRELLAQALLQLSVTQSEAAHFDAALVTSGEARRLCEADGNVPGVAWSWFYDGRTLRRSGAYSEAVAEFQRARASFDEIGAVPEVALCDIQLCWCADAIGLAAAEYAALRALPTIVTTQDPYNTVLLIEAASMLSARTGNHVRAARLSGVSEHWRSRTLSARSQADHRLHEQALYASRDALGNAGFAAEVAVGTQLTLRTALDLIESRQDPLALRSLASPVKATAPLASTDGI